MGYKKFNVNPKGLKCDDCAIRAVAVALNTSWDDIYRQLFDIGFELKRPMSDLVVIDKLLKRNGFMQGSIKVAKGESRPTVAEFANSHKDMICILRVAHHLVACAKGIYVDTWDCGSKSVYKYWYKNI